MKLYKPLIISGPSGVGKGAIHKMLRKEFPETFELSISLTTRKIREGEEDGVDYHFIDLENFE